MATTMTTYELMEIIIAFGVLFVIWLVASNWANHFEEKFWMIIFGMAIFIFNFLGEIRNRLIFLKRILSRKNERPIKRSRVTITRYPELEEDMLGI